MKWRLCGFCTPKFTRFEQRTVWLQTPKNRRTPFFSKNHSLITIRMESPETEKMTHPESFNQLDELIGLLGASKQEEPLRPADTSAPAAPGETPESLAADRERKLLFASLAPDWLAAQVAEQNPHAAQLCTNAVKPCFSLVSDLTLRALDTLPKTISADSPRMEYSERPIEERSTLHWGQRKLTIMEYGFLGDVLSQSTGADEKALVVYAGAAPGRHIPDLAAHFPGVPFHLFDPAAFDPLVLDPQLQLNAGITPLPHLEVHQCFFDEAWADVFRKTVDDGAVKKLIFICDIRTADPLEQTKADVQVDVQKDMERQQAWCLRMRPYASLLKFRLPWAEGVTNYLRGEIRIQPWAPTTSTETRLVVKRNDLDQQTEYDNRAYEEALAFHNTIGRVRLYDHGIPSGLIPGFDHCFDCALEASYLQGFLEKRGMPAAAEDVARFAKQISARTGGRTHATEYLPSSTRQSQKFPARTYRDTQGNDAFSVRGRQNKNQGQKRGGPGVRRY